MNLSYFLLSNLYMFIYGNLQFRSRFLVYIECCLEIIEKKGRMDHTLYSVNTEKEMPEIIN